MLLIGLESTKFGVKATFSLSLGFKVAKNWTNSEPIGQERYSAFKSHYENSKYPKITSQNIDRPEINVHFDYAILSLSFDRNQIKTT